MTETQTQKFIDRGRPWTQEEVALLNVFILNEGNQFHTQRKVRRFFTKMGNFIGSRERRQCTKKFQLCFKAKSNIPITTFQYISKQVAENGQINEQKKINFLQICQKALKEKFKQKQSDVKRYMLPVYRYLQKMESRLDKNQTPQDRQEREKNKRKYQRILNAHQREDLDINQKTNTLTILSNSAIISSIGMTSESINISQNIFSGPYFSDSREQCPFFEYPQYSN